MNIIPMMKCANMEESILFYTHVLDFEWVGTWPETGAPSFSVLQREGAELHLSSHSGDGVTGAVVSIIAEDIDMLFIKYIGRGLKPGNKNSPVHQSPVSQTWGTREFYVDDPNGNTLRFIQRS